MTLRQRNALANPQTDAMTIRRLRDRIGPPAVLCGRRGAMSIIVAIEEEHGPQAVGQGWLWHASVRPGTEDQAASELDGVGAGDLIFLAPDPRILATHAFKRLSDTEMETVLQALRRMRS